MEVYVKRQLPIPLLKQGITNRHFHPGGGHPSHAWHATSFRGGGVLFFAASATANHAALLSTLEASIAKGQVALARLHISRGIS
jgi:hypothetical protein